jgi:hypothetical protein
VSVRVRSDEAEFLGRADQTETRCHRIPVIDRALFSLVNEEPSQVGAQTSGFGHRFRIMKVAEHDDRSVPKKDRPVAFVEALDPRWRTQFEECDHRRLFEIRAVVAQDHADVARYARGKDQAFDNAGVRFAAGESAIQGSESLRRKDKRALRCEQLPKTRRKLVLLDRRGVEHTLILRELIQESLRLANATETAFTVEQACRLRRHRWKLRQGRKFRAETGLRHLRAHMRHRVATDFRHFHFGRPDHARTGRLRQHRCNRGSRLECVIPEHENSLPIIFELR